MISRNNDYFKKSIEYKTPIGNDNYYKQETITELKNNLDNNDIYLLSKLNILRISLSSENINLRNIRNEIKELTEFNEKQNYEYLVNLIHPEKARGCKIPSQIPVPSCSFQLHNCITLQTNSAGNLAFWMNPCMLASERALGTKTADNGYWIHKFLSSAWVNNDAALSGNSGNANWVPVDFGQVLPPVYNQYRLVSAALDVRYIGRLDSASGVLGGSIILEDINSLGGYVQSGSGSYNPSAQGTPTICPELERYGNFELARDSYYNQENSCLEGIRLLYFPIDNSYEEYVAITGDHVIEAAVDNNKVAFLSNVKNGFNWMFYTQGAPGDANCFKVDLYCNFECLPDPTFLNYMPISSYPFSLTSEERKKFIMMVQSKPIRKLKEDEEEEIGIPNIFLKLIKKFKNGLPSFEKMRAWGLLNAVPSLLPGIALASNMISSNMSNLNNY